MLSATATAADPRPVHRASFRPEKSCKISATPTPASSPAPPTFPRLAGPSPFPRPGPLGLLLTALPSAPRLAHRLTAAFPVPAGRAGPLRVRSCSCPRQGLRQAPQRHPFPRLPRPRCFYRVLGVCGQFLISVCHRVRLRFWEEYPRSSSCSELTHSSTSAHTSAGSWCPSLPRRNPFFIILLYF